MKYYNLAACVLGTGIFLNAGTALAGPETYSTINTTTVDGSNGTAYTTPGNYIGNDFQTTGMSVVQNGSTATINYYTYFGGSAFVNNYTVGYSDIFFGGIGAGYAISLGDQTLGTTGTQGVSAGLYSVTSAETSQQIWGSRSGIIYGQAYNNGQSAYTVVTGGNFVEGVSITDTKMGNGEYDLAVTLTGLPMDLVQALENGSLTMFWGTGDCANGAFIAAAAAVPEPASYMALIAGVMAIGFISWRRSAPAATPKA